MTESESIIHSIEIAERFCTLIEHRQPSTDDGVVYQFAVCLADLYSSAVILSLLPLESDAEDVIENTFSTEQVQAITQDIGHAFGEARWYWEVFDPHEESVPVVGDLADDLADIYRDVKGGVVAFHRGRENEAIRNWQESFRYHWGDHVVDALRVLHRHVSAKLIDHSLEEQ